RQYAILRSGRYGALVTFSMTTSWLGTAAAVYEPMKVPKSAWLQRSRTFAVPAVRGRPSAVNDTAMDAVPVSLRLNRATARAFEPDSVFDQTCRPVPGDATRRPCIPSGS